MKTFLNKNMGGMSILGMLILGIIIILALSYFKVSIKSIVESPTGQENITYVTSNSKTIWDKYLKDPMTYFWNEVAIKIFWRSFIDNMERIRDGRVTDFQKFGPTAFPGGIPAFNTNNDLTSPQ